ncbi:AOC03_06830 family ribosome hibernation factor [Chitinophaga arvensicola]|uniref:ERF1 domain-containing protein 3 n=1 Tax=Chitinophaga arvensicola TaxID=29529 RepID=A0A1I0S4S1_9BACT|nr:hypothetical protein [Chitinophaga arvensicola]SEW49790.1 hypothetical protein SAMN04488122_3577 [Chitinophaga arvensicola]
MEQALMTLSQYHGAPAVTILLSTHRTHPDNKQDPIQLKKLTTEAETRLYELYDKREVWPVLDKIKAAEAEINHDYNLESLAIFANTDGVQVFKLPIATTDRVVIGDRFEIRPLLKAWQQQEHYYILTIAKQKIRLLEAYNDTLIREINNADFPLANQYFTTDPMKLQQDAIVDDLLKEYFNVADKKFKPYYHENPLPVILLGDTKSIAYYQEQMDIKNIVIATAPGSYDDTTAHEILKVTFPLIQQHMADKQQGDLNDIEAAQSKQKVLNDLGDIYRAAEAGAAETLYLEKNYFFQGAIDNGTIAESGKPGAEDVSLVVIDTVLSKGGKVVFMDENTLNAYQGIALVTRY